MEIKKPSGQASDTSAFVLDNLCGIRGLNYRYCMYVAPKAEREAYLDAYKRVGKAYGSLETDLETKCDITAAMIRWALTGKTQGAWQTVNTDANDMMMELVKYCQISFDDEDHWITIEKGQVYDSRWSKPQHFLQKNKISAKLPLTTPNVLTLMREFGYDITTTNYSIWLLYPNPHKVPEGIATMEQRVAELMKKTLD